MAKIIKYLITLILLNQILFTKIKKSDKDLEKINHDLKEYKITNIFPRKSLLYTQGLFFEENGDTFYESGGKYKQSTLNKFKYPSMELIKSINLDEKYFGEGIAKCGEYIFQLTWKENEVIKYNAQNMEFIEKFYINPPRNGWGLSAFKDDLLLATDGSDKIYVLDCSKKLKVIDTLNVKYNNYGIFKLNDLIYVDKFIYLNRYFDTKILKVNAINGNVEKVFDMKSLLDHEYSKNTLDQESYNHGCVLNGIAYNPKNKKFLLTGKKWGFYYEIDLF